MFQVGDKVRCVNANAAWPNGLIVGNEYVISETYNDEGLCCVEGLPSGFYLHRFELIKEPAVQGFKVGDGVAFISDPFTFYTIQKINNKGHIKVFELPYYYRADRFKLVKKGANIPPKDPPPPNLMRELTRKVKEVRKNNKCCSYAIEDVEGKQKYHVADICHARLSRAYHDVKVKAIALNVSGYVQEHDEDTQPIYEEYVDYIIHRSPWSKAFIPTDIDTVMNSGVYLDVTKPYSYCVSAAVALRIGSELYGGKTLDNFKKAKEAGLSENQAFLLFNTFTKDFGYQTNGGSHDVWDAGTNAESVAKFFNDTDVNVLEEQTYNQVVNSHYTITGVVGPCKGESIYNVLFKTNKYVNIVRAAWGAINGSVIGDTPEEKFANACLIVKEFIN